MFQSPSYHHISPVSRSRSEVRSSPLMRSTTYSGSTYSGTPAYGYGGGYMSRSLSRSGSTLFGRSLRSSALHSTPPLHSIAVQRNTPHYSDKYPYVRYSYGNIDTGLGISAQTSTVGRSYSSPRESTTRQYLGGKWNPYTSNLHKSPSYESRVERPLTPSRNYVKYMPIDDAMSMYKKNCMTVGTLSKYWLSPTTWQSRREKEANMSYSISTGQYSYASRMPFKQNIASGAQKADGGNIVNLQAKHIGGPRPDQESEKDDITFEQNIQEGGQEARNGGSIHNRQAYHVATVETVSEPQKHTKTHNPIANAPNYVDDDEDMK